MESFRKLENQGSDTEEPPIDELTEEKQGIEEPQLTETTQEVLADKEIAVPEDYPARTVNNYGDVYFDRVRYRVGKDLSASKVVKVGEKYGAIIDQDGKVTHIFDLLPVAEKDQRIEKTGKPNTTIAARLSEMNLRPIDDHSITAEVIQELQTAIESYEKPAETPKERMLELLQQEGILQIKDGLKVWDTEKIKQISWRRSGRITLPGQEKAQSLMVNGKSYANFTDFYRLLNNESGVSVEEYQRTEDKTKLQPKKLFYSPENLEQAFDPEAIKSSDYHLTPWEITKQIPNWGREISLANGEKLTWAELYLPHLIYKELKGKRDEQGSLSVWNQKKGEHTPFSAKMLREVYGINIGSAYDNFAGHPVEYLQKHASKVLQSGALHLEDFRLIADTAASELIRKRKTAGRKGTFSWRVIYDLGTEFEDRDIVCLNLDAEKGRDLMGVVESQPDGTEVITHTFRVLPREETEQAKDKYRSSLLEDEKYQSGMIHFGLKKLSSDPKDPTKRFDKIELSEYKKTKDNPPLPGESYEDYAERISLVQNFGFIEKVSKELAKDCGIGIHNLSWREQEWLVTGWHELASRKEEIKQLAKDFGLNGLRSFLSLEYGVKEMGSKVLDLAKQAEKDIAQAVFAKYAEIVKAVNQTAEYLGENFKADNFTVSRQQVQEITRRLLTKGKDLLVKFADQMNSGQTVKTEEVIADLENVKTEILLFASVFKTVNQESPIDFEQIKNTTLELKPATELTEAEREEMMKIFIANRKGKYPERLLKDSQKEFTSAMFQEISEFHVLKYKGEIVAFMRFDTLPEGRFYAGSLNVQSEIKGSAIGSEMLKKALDKKSQENIIEAIAYMKIPMIKKYFGEYGFTAKGLELNHHGTGETFFLMERDNRLNQTLVSKEMNKEEIVTKFKTNVYAVGQPVVILNYNLESEYNRVKAQSDILLNQEGYRLTRFLPEGDRAYMVFEKPRASAQKLEQAA